MAIINSPWVGNARGKMGEGVYAKVKGQTTARSYNPSPLNRRTAPQQTQRAVFSSAVRFYSRGVQNLFLFAFEDKKATESDYNAFMRYNAKKGIYFGKEQNESDNYPSVGAFSLTRGSIPGPSVVITDGGRSMAQFAVTSYPTAAITTVGELSQALVSAGYMQGDIITSLVIRSTWEPGDMSEPVTAGSKQPEWVISQFTVDVGSTLLLSSTVFGAVSSGDFINLTQQATEIDPETVCGHAWIVSRVIDGKVYVSSSDLQLNSPAEEALYYGRSDTWLNIVLESYKSEGKSILQGSRSVNGEPVKLSITRNFELPIQVRNLVGGESSFITSQPLTAEEFARRSAFLYSPTSGGSSLMTSWRALNQTTVRLVAPSGAALFSVVRNSQDYNQWTVEATPPETSTGYLNTFFIFQG